MKNFKAETIVSKLFKGVSDRIETLKVNDHVVSDEFTKKNGILEHFNPEGASYRMFLDAIEKTKGIFDFEPMMKIISKAKPSGSNDAAYIQAKAIEKVIKFVKAFGQKDFRILDNHTRAITMNAMVNTGKLSSRSAFASLVRVEYDALESQDERLVSRHNYTAGTGSTQLSSTRELFRMLGLCEGIKGAKDAAIVFTAESQQALLEHFEQIAIKTGAPVAQQDDEEGDSD